MGLSDDGYLNRLPVTGYVLFVIKAPRASMLAAPCQRRTSKIIINARLTWRVSILVSRRGFVERTRSASVFPDMELQYIPVGMVRHVSNLHGSDRPLEGAHHSSLHEHDPQGGGILFWQFDPIYEFFIQPSSFAAQD